MDRLEQLVISGDMFRPSEPDSPPRSRSSSPFSDFTDEDDLFPELDSSSRPPSPPPSGPPPPSIGNGVPGRTGVKGVIRDAAEHRGIEREKRAQEVLAHNSKLEKGALLAKSYREEVEDEKAREEERRIMEEMRERRMKHILSEKGVGGGKAPGAGSKRFGHLRDVGMEGFVHAVEENSDTPVLVHLYHSSVDRCITLDHTLTTLARSHPYTKFLRARAAALGFASLLSPSPASATDLTTSVEYYPDEEDYADEEEEDVDLDMLPTVLVYRGGELVETWVRVDWEAQRVGGVEQLLIKHGVIIQSSSSRGGDSSDEEQDTDDY